MIESKIDYYEKEFLHFKPFEHFYARIEEMKNISDYGAKVASKWSEIVNQSLRDEVYPVVHPIGQETFSLYVEFPTGVFECALDIDGATSLINKENIKPAVFEPSNIIASVDIGNINTDTSNIKTNHKNPVMVIQSKFLTDNKPYCINGNHRIYEAYRNNEKQIEVYYFKDLEFEPFFYDILSRSVYFLEIDYHNVINNERKFLND
ncbi:hypothetical protein [Oceanobacillus sp. J11TS1]|uniref:hypothetical protein n=1 Tax=Oceanobacillus sp. J11TS1 TaxID=2807191 RepID=UPI001B0F6243|nr:hypothetical protein [Oceanobacillus sp. J11TS1]GIO24302.1 hypothetical protein J11TS1_28830 [Oceanobacillus sp. J11TS1]